MSENITGQERALKEAQLSERFREAVDAMPFVAEAVAAGKQFNAYESADNGEDEADEDREYALCIGPITNARYLLDIDGKPKADLLETALKLAAHIAYGKAALPHQPATAPASDTMLREDVEAVRELAESHLMAALDTLAIYDRASADALRDSFKVRAALTQPEPTAQQASALDQTMADNPGWQAIEPIDREALEKIMASSGLPGELLTILVAHRMASQPPAEVQQPVAWLYTNDEGDQELLQDGRIETARRLLEQGYTEQPLYTTPQQGQEVEG